MVNANYQVVHLKLPVWKAIHIHACYMHVWHVFSAINRNKGLVYFKSLESVVAVLMFECHTKWRALLSWFELILRKMA